MRWLLSLVACAWLLAIASPAGAKQAQQLFPAERCVQASMDMRTPWALCPEQAGPTDYRQGWVWRVVEPAAGQTSVTVRTSRFEQVVVLFRYADGLVVREQARSGQGGSHWQIGGTLAFDARERSAPLVQVAVGFENAHWAHLLKATLSKPPVSEGADGKSLLIGAAMTLLLLCLLANAAVGVALKRVEPLWNAGWAACVLGWAVMWTQIALPLLPALAGTASARLVTFFATGAIGCAGAYLLAATPTLGRRLRGFLQGAAVLVLVTGGFTAATPGQWLPYAATALNISILLATAGVVAACATSWRAGNPAVRHFAWSFLVPTAAVLWSIMSDRGLTGDDDRGMYLVLVACALQTVWLALLSSGEMLRVRRERDAAREAESRLTHIAETDPLTGLLNRRGFIGRAERLIARGRPFALVLLDLDRFKMINDVHGHQVGDEVLRSIAHTLTRARFPHQAVVGRLGGEEFGVLVEEPAKALPLAEQLRLTIAHLPIAAGGASFHVTASFGIASTQGERSWTTLYKLADAALYEAKANGRNLVLCSPGTLSNAA